jgi:uroporphyrin-III C-methyltransferase/precorrin-2 dehydrogenase/sirohydrochlorin ferrochelatase/uroporphyrin-III C-methyltransferase
MLHRTPRDLPSGAGPRVYLIGAGPGDPDLLTRKAFRLLQEADVVVHDRLVGDAVLDLIPPATPRIYVGKATRRHTLPQDAINELLFDLALRHRCVVRLKGGDPFVFGRGGEEAEYLVRRGIACEVVPGVTAAAGCAAEAGIPLTHRGLAMGVQFITGHVQDDGELDLDWDRLADAAMTTVVYMGLATAPRLSERLIACGLDPNTPAAAISNGTTPERRMCISTLARLPADIEQAGLASPALLIIGRVVVMAAILNAGPGIASDDIPLPVFDSAPNLEAMGSV